MPTYFELFPPWGPDGRFLGPSPNHPMFSGWTSNAPAAAFANTSSVTLESLAATMAKLKPLPRDVFVFPGNMGQFKALLEANGVKVVGDTLVDPSPYPLPVPPILSGLECWEIEGEVWVARSYRDVED